MVQKVDDLAGAPVRRLLRLLCGVPVLPHVFLPVFPREVVLLLSSRLHSLHVGRHAKICGFGTARHGMVRHAKICGFGMVRHAW